MAFLQNRSISLVDMYIDNSEPSENVGQIHFSLEYDFQNTTLILRIIQVSKEDKIFITIFIGFLLKQYFLCYILAFHKIYYSMPKCFSFFGYLGSFKSILLIRKEISLASGLSQLLIIFFKLLKFQY